MTLLQVVCCGCRCAKYFKSYLKFFILGVWKNCDDIQRAIMTDNNEWAIKAIPNRNYSTFRWIECEHIVNKLDELIIIILPLSIFFCSAPLIRDIGHLTFLHSAQEAHNAYQCTKPLLSFAMISICFLVLSSRANRFWWLRAHSVVAKNANASNRWESCVRRSNVNFYSVWIGQRVIAIILLFHLPPLSVALSLFNMK